MQRALVIVVALGLGGCVLDFGSGDDTACPDDLDQPGGDVVNPSTLACEEFGQAACGEFDPNLPSWGDCGRCAEHDEATCVNVSSCRAAYDHDCLFGTGACPAVTAFLGCFPVDRNPDFATGCEGLDAWNCSRHEQCFSTHRFGTACHDGADNDGDSSIDEADECTLGFVRCLAEQQPF